MGKGYRRRSSNLYLNKYSHSNSQWSNKNIINNIIDMPVNEEFINLKNYIISKFMDPMINKQFGNVKENFFNFEYIEQKLNEFNIPKLSIEIELLKKIVMVMKTAVETRFTIDNANIKMYGEKSNLFLIETSKIVLKAKYEIYTLICGDPKIKNSDFEPSILNIIQKHLDNSPGCTVNHIRSKLKNEYGSLFV